MDFIPLLKAKKNAIFDCKTSTELPPQKRKQMEGDLQMIDYGSWATKGVLALAIISGVDWKRKVPILKREIPLALGAITLSAVSDYFVLEYFWSQHQKQVNKLTGFKNGIYVKPEVMARMRSNMNKRQLSFEDQFQIEDEDQKISVNK